MKPIVIIRNDTLSRKYTNENITNKLECDSGDYCVIREVMDGHVGSGHVEITSTIKTEPDGTMYKAKVMIGDLEVPCILWERNDGTEHNFIAVDNQYAI
ncbi:hypothetical protein VPHK469_0208 [Vibrio phage K469]